MRPLPPLQTAGIRAQASTNSNPNDFLAKLRSRSKKPSLSAEQKAAFLEERGKAASDAAAEGEESYVGTSIERAIGVDYGRK